MMNCKKYSARRSAAWSMLRTGWTSTAARAALSILGDACDTEFWLKLRKDIRLELVILAMPNHQGNMYAAHQLRNFGFDCQVAAIARYPRRGRGTFGPRGLCGLQHV
jgi:hypothetical protein